VEAGAGAASEDYTFHIAGSRLAGGGHVNGSWYIMCVAR
jgi:hypothetical protein